jgi:hypothetical protein
MRTTPKVYSSKAWSTSYCGGKGGAMGNVEVKWITDDFFRLAESPLWDELNNRLFWVDIPGTSVRHCAGGTR